MLDLSGNGAMTANDIKTLQLGYLTSLPCDSMGRAVLYYDRSKRPSQCEQAPRRILFFTLQTAMENESSRNNGFVMLVNMLNPFAAFDLEVARHSMPMKVAIIHLICNHPSATSLHPSLKTSKFQHE